MAVRQWNMRIQIPQAGIDEVKVFEGSYPWTAMGRADYWALRKLAEHLETNAWGFRLISNVDKIEPFTTTFMGRVKPRSKKKRVGADGNITLEPVKPVEGFVPLF